MICLLAPTVFRPVARQKHHGERAWQRKAIYLMAARKKGGDKERAGDKTCPSKECPQ
jgi:hypothetical protein